MICTQKHNVHNLCKDRKKESAISTMFPQAHGFCFWKKWDFQYAIEFWKCWNSCFLNCNNHPLFQHSSDTSIMSNL